ncbi:MAG: homoserine kinase [Caulobacteraceae bacterium]
MSIVEVKVPATSANMGPGFDCLGVALNLYNSFRVEESEGDLCMDGCEEAYRNKNNLVYVSMQKCFEKIGYRHKGKGLKISFKSDIPVSRGLGSSAACILGGVLAANEIGKGNLSRNEILEIATEIEGHPDNITPALFGGMTVSVKEGKQVYFERIKLPRNLKFCAIIPDFRLSTKDSRAVLPGNIPYKDGVYNVGRVSLLIAALSNENYDLLKHACRDKLHQIYRGSLIGNYNEIIEECNRLDALCVFLSGAGPTIMTVLKEEDSTFKKHMEDYLLKLKNKWVIKELRADLDGACVENIQQGGIL